MSVIWSWYWTRTLPTVSLNTQPDRRLYLRDFVRNDLIVDFAALITASDDDTWFATSQRGGSDTVPTEGELGLGVDEVPITRIQTTHSGARVLLNQNTSDFSLQGHFAESGDSDWTLRIQTVDDVVETTNIINRGNTFINFGIATGDRTTIDDIDDGDRVIVAAYQLPS